MKSQERKLRFELFLALGVCLAGCSEDSTRPQDSDTGSNPDHYASSDADVDGDADSDGEADSAEVTAS